MDEVPLSATYAHLYRVFHNARKPLLDFKQIQNDKTCGFRDIDYNSFHLYLTFKDIFYFMLLRYAFMLKKWMQL